MNKKIRTESDSVGTLEVPSEAYYGVQSLRGYHNFRITGRAIHKDLIFNIAKIKKAASLVNARYGFLDKKISEAIIVACDEIIRGEFTDEFIVDAIEGGAGTSANMNANEVIANRAEELLGGKKGEYKLCHPNDHVNMAQSTNDVIPTAAHLTVLDLMKPLLSALEELAQALGEKSEEFDQILKMGRTQLQDAVPMRLGQSFRAFASAVSRDIKRLTDIQSQMLTINLGATAIGTALNVEPEYFHNITKQLSLISGYELVQATDLFDATQNADCFVAVSGILKACAVNLSKMSNDLRLLSSGPRTGIGEITLPPMQNGSSIMPGKINPVIPEVVSQVAFLVIGHDVTIAMAAEAGQMELNAFEPVICNALFESITTLTGAVKTLTENCIRGIVANFGRCAQLVEASVGVVTALCPYIGYKKSAAIAREALETGVKVRDIVRREKLMDDEILDKALDPYAMTEPRTLSENNKKTI
ncbi:MAG: Aspartate ammonia-lyase [Firmicutes bacterium ADurb.Bin300]|nr:MAG: Aspartate ammonia-lyase [Firmicutes bacterium ADurb.Bin300]